ncbi:MAG: LptF/LptG family permease [Candidatus Goldbacteria bacterium]|nr:LptF/LptG family permease [Candidatus Goldiibacteriota bacterium]
MKIISRYIAIEVALIFLISFFIFTFFLVMNSLFVLSDFVIEYRIGVIKVLKLLIFLLPSTVAVTVPMGVLVGILLTYSRLVQDNEYTGMQACGIPVKSISSPSIFFSLFITFLMIIFNNTILPSFNLKYKKLYYEIVKKRAGIVIQQHTFINDFDNYIFYIGEKDNKNDILKNIIVFVKQTQNSPVKVILSKYGELISDEESLRISLKLKDGFAQVVSANQPTKLSQMFFDTNFVELDVKGILRNKNTADNLKSTREMNFFELVEEARKGEKSKEGKHWIWMELHKKFSLPFACMVFAITGIPLGLITKKGGRLMGISLSLILIFIYYIFLIIGQNYGYRGKMDYFLAAWLPNIVLILIGIFFFVWIMLPQFKNKFISFKRLKK